MSNNLEMTDFDSFRTPNYIKYPKPDSEGTASPLINASDNIEAWCNIKGENQYETVFLSNKRVLQPPGELQVSEPN